MEQNLTAMEFKINEIAARIRELRLISGYTPEDMERLVKTIKMYWKG